MKKFLLISFAFPPKNVVGALRPYRLCRYLPEKGWMPTVITSRINKKGQSQTELLKAIDDNIEIFRTPSMDFARNIERMFKQLKNRLHLLRSSKPQNGKNIPSQILNYNRKPFKKASKRLKNIVTEGVTTPDPNIYWGICILTKGISILRKNKGEFKAIITTSPPHSSHLFGILLSKWFRIPHVMDLRDPWLDVYRGYQSPIRRKIEKKMEALAVKKSKYIISSTEEYTNEISKRYPKLLKEKFTTITNSFEEDKFEKIKGNDSKNFLIAYLGIFYPRRNPYCFFKALSSWIKENPYKNENIKMQIIGDSDPTTNAVILKENLSDIIHVTGRLSHKEAIKKVKSADLLLMLMGTGIDTPTGWVPSKLYEYMACHKPILANIPKGMASKIIKETKSGYVVHDNNIEKIKIIIDQEYKRKMCPEKNIAPFIPDKEKISMYGTKSTTNQFHMLLEKL